VIWFQVLDSSESLEGRRRLWWLPALMLLWANVHGGFVVGFVLLGMYMLSDAILYYRCREAEEQKRLAARLRELGIVAGLSMLASLINPYGYGLHVHVYRYLSSRWLMNHIDEFLSPNFHGVAQQCFVAILLISIVALAMSRRKPSLAQGLVLLFATHSGLYASRSLPVSSLLLTLIVAPLLMQAVADARSDARLSSRLTLFLSQWHSLNARIGDMEFGFRGHLWPVAAVLFGVLACGQQGRIGSRRWMNAGFDPGRLPVQSAEVIVERGIREPVFCQDSWGGYLIYRLYPQNKVFVDDRHDLYGEEFLKDYLKAILVAPEWDKFLSEKRVNWALLPAESSLANMLKETSKWGLVYRDKTSVLLERKDKI